VEAMVARIARYARPHQTETGKPRKSGSGSLRRPKTAQKKAVNPIWMVEKDTGEIQIAYLPTKRMCPANERAQAKASRSPNPIQPTRSGSKESVARPQKESRAPTKAVQCGFSLVSAMARS